MTSFKFQVSSFKGRSASRVPVKVLRAKLLHFHSPLLRPTGYEGQALDTSHSGLPGPVGAIDVSRGLQPTDRTSLTNPRRVSGGLPSRVRENLGGVRERGRPARIWSTAAMIPPAF